MGVRVCKRAVWPASGRVFMLAGGCLRTDEWATGLVVCQSYIQLARDVRSVGERTGVVAGTALADVGMSGRIGGW